MSFIDGVLKVIRSRLYDHRTCTPGKVDTVDLTSALREQSVSFEPGIPDLMAQTADPKGPTPSAPVLSIAMGGFYMLLPAAAGDEVLGLVSDRPLGVWRGTKSTTQVDKIFGLRTGSLSDVMIAPLAITAPAGAPVIWDGLVIGGPEGPAIEITELGEVTITKQGIPVATITMDAAGSVTIEVIPGQSVNVGGPAAVALAKWAQLDAAITAMFVAGISAGTGAPGTTGTLAFTAAQTAYNALAPAVPTTKAKGE